MKVTLTETNAFDSVKFWNRDVLYDLVELKETEFLCCLLKDLLNFEF